MKSKILFLLASIFIGLNIHAQTVIWTENFQNGCAAACPGGAYVGPNGAWTQTITGAEGADPNTWFVSCAENNTGVGNCSAPCQVTPNQTMHISAKLGNPFCPNDCGAAYDAGGACGFFFCPETNRRIESPTINLTGQTSVSINFEYIEGGDLTVDNATLWYFNGATWSQIDDMPKSSTAGCSGQGRWGNRTVALPASSNNNANVKIGFRWVNNDDGVGTDPSFAVDNITLTIPTTTGPTANFSASDSTVCVGDCINFTDLSTGSPTGWTWYFPGSTVPTSNTQNPTNICYNTVGSFPVSLVVTDGVGTDSLFMPNFITVAAKPNVTANAAPSTTVCSGTMVTLTGGGASTYTWTGGVTNGVAFPITTTTSYIVTGTNAAGCTDTASITITITPKDTAAFTYPSGSYCLTDPNPLPTITGTTGGTFTINNSGVINATTGLINITGSGIGNYIVTYITNGTCPDTATFNIAIVNSVNATITPAGPFCANDPSVTLSAVSPGGTWSGTGITNATTGVFDPNTAGPGTHTITYGISGSCGDTQTVSIIVNPSDTATFSFTPTTFCDTDPNPTPTGIVTTGGTFTINNSGTINSATGEVNISASGAGSYTITYITNGACPDTATFSITITTCTVPTAAYAVSDSTICEGSCVTFTDLSTGATTWQWTFNGGTPLTANTKGPHTVCFGAAGIYNMELIASNSTGADTITSTVEVYATPTVNAGNDVTIDLGQSVTLNATGTNGTHTWSPPIWLDCITCSSPVATPQETTTYTVIVVDSNGCTASDDVTIIVDFDYVIWVPNIFSPNGDGNNDIAFVRGVGVEYLNFVIFDRWGEKVFETNDINNGWDGTFRGQKMNNGVFVYYLQATFKNGEEVTKKGDITLIR
jgi:gliding motility-associated-like protein